MKISFKYRAAKTSSSRSKTYRRFIPDARPIAASAERGAFWYKVWQGMRARA